jgi:hypothetical protein
MLIAERVSAFLNKLLILLNVLCKLAPRAQADYAPCSLDLALAAKLAPELLQLFLQPAHVSAGNNHCVLFLAGLCLQLSSVLVRSLAFFEFCSCSGFRLCLLCQAPFLFLLLLLALFGVCFMKCTLLPFHRQPMLSSGVTLLNLLAPPNLFR